MSQAAALERAFREAGRAGLTRREIAEVLGDGRFVAARIAELKRRGWVFNERRSRYGSRIFRWVAVSWPGEARAEVEGEPEALFDASALVAPASALLGGDA